MFGGALQGSIDFSKSGASQKLVEEGVGVGVG
jgi:hypothetical protein